MNREWDAAGTEGSGGDGHVTIPFGFPPEGHVILDQAGW